MFFRRKKYKVKFKGIDEIIYEEGGKKMSLDSDFGTHPLSIVLFTDDIRKWDSPYDKESLTEEDRSRIVENIITSFEKG